MDFGLRRYSGLMIAAPAIFILVLLSKLEFVGAVRVPLVWSVLVIVPGILLGRWEGRFGSSSGLDFWAQRLVLGWIVLLGSLGLAALLGIPPRFLPWIWGACCMGLALAVPAGTASNRSMWRLSWPPLALFLVCLVLVGRTPPQMSVESDLAAHLGGIHDSMEQQRWLPRDHSVDPDEPRRDPRFGILHGLHGAVAGQLGLDVVREVQGSAPFFAAAFILCHTALFAALGLPMALALGAAAVYAMGAAGGAPLGWWAAFYPSQVALGVAAGCGALGLNAVARSLRPGAVLVLAGSGLGLSALIHPFAWWGWGLVLVHAAILALASARRRDRLVPLALYAGPALILGLTAMLPLLRQGANPDGVQGEVAGVMMIGERMFTMDPLLVLRFGGGLGLLAAPLFLLATRARWRRDTGIWLGLAAALPVWTVAMNPLLQPLVFTQVGYLSERLGELAWIPALAFLPFFARASDGRPRFSSPSLLAGAAALAMLLGLPHALRAGTSSPYPSDLSLESLRDLDLELAQLEIDRVASDPGLSYLLRGVGGGYALIQPAEHCSPLDRGVEARLAAYRRLLSPRYPISALAEGLSRMGANGLIVDEAVENRYRFATHGFVPSNERQEALIRRLSEAGVEPDLRSGSFLIYSMPTLRAATAVGETRPESSPSCETTLVDPLVGGDFTVIGLDLAAEAVTRGDELKLRICYVEGGDPAAWDTVRLRLEGPMPHIPGWASGFSKIYRKIIVERSGRSRARFRDAWVPLDGYWLGAAEEGPIVGEWRSIAIPEDIAPGEYDLQLSVHNEAWRPVRRIADFLRDEDSWSAPAVAVVRIEEGEEE